MLEVYKMGKANYLPIFVVLAALLMILFGKGFDGDELLPTTGTIEDRFCSKLILLTLAAMSSAVLSFLVYLRWHLLRVVKIEGTPFQFRAAIGGVILMSVGIWLPTALSSWQQATQAWTHEVDQSVHELLAALETHWDDAENNPLVVGERPRQPFRHAKQVAGNNEAPGELPELPSPEEQLRLHQERMEAWIKTADKILEQTKKDKRFDRSVLKSIDDRLKKPEASNNTAVDDQKPDASKNTTVALPVVADILRFAETRVIESDGKIESDKQTVDAKWLLVTSPRDYELELWVYSPDTANPVLNKLRTETKNNLLTRSAQLSALGLPKVADTFKEAAGLTDQVRTFKNAVHPFEKDLANLAITIENVNREKKPDWPDCFPGFKAWSSDDARGTQVRWNKGLTEFIAAANRTVATERGQVWKEINKLKRLGKELYDSLPQSNGASLAISPTTPTASNANDSVKEKPPSEELLRILTKLDELRIGEKAPTQETQKTSSETERIIVSKYDNQPDAALRRHRQKYNGVLEELKTFIGKQKDSKLVDINNKITESVAILQNTALTQWDTSRKTLWKFGKTLHDKKAAYYDKKEVNNRHWPDFVYVGVKLAISDIEEELNRFPNEFDPLEPFPKLDSRELFIEMAKLHAWNMLNMTGSDRLLSNYVDFPQHVGSPQGPTLGQKIKEEWKYVDSLSDQELRKPGKERLAAELAQKARNVIFKLFDDIALDQAAKTYVVFNPNTKLEAAKKLEMKELKDLATLFDAAKAQKNIEVMDSIPYKAKQRWTGDSASEADKLIDATEPESNQVADIKDAKLKTVIQFAHHGRWWNPDNGYISKLKKTFEKDAANVTERARLIKICAAYHSLMFKPQAGNSPGGFYQNPFEDFDENGKSGQSDSSIGSAANPKQYSVKEQAGIWKTDLTTTYRRLREDYGIPDNEIIKGSPQMETYAKEYEAQSSKQPKTISGSRGLK